MNSNIYDRKKHSYKNRPYYCPIHNRWFYPYIYMNPYMSYMMNPYMNPYMAPYMTPEYYYGNMYSCNNMNKYGAMRGYKEDAHKIEKEDIYIPQYEEELYANRKKEGNKKKYYEEDSLDDIVIFDENDEKEEKEHIKKEENLQYKQKKTSDSDLKITHTEKRGIQLEEVNKEEESNKLKENELHKKAKINMRKVPLKEIID